MDDEFDFDAAYKVEGFGGIAWRVIGYNLVEEYTDHNDEEGLVENQSQVRCHMIGDDSVHIFDIDYLTKIDESEYCPECGQIGCKAYG